MTDLVPTPDPLSKRTDRRSVQMRAYLVRANKQIIDVSVGDLSYTGCAVHTETPLEEGEVVLLSVLGRGAGNATVRWYKDRRAGLEFDVDESQRQHVPRTADRAPIAAEVLLRRSAHSGYRVRVFDASPSGCRCEFVDRPSIGERVWVKFDGLEAIESEVRWLEDANVGLKFLRAVHPAVFEVLLQRLR